MKISHLILILIVGLIAFQALASSLIMAALLGETSTAYMKKQGRRSSAAIIAYMDEALQELSTKAHLISGQKRIVEFTRFGLFNLLEYELDAARQSSRIDYLTVSRDGRVLARSGDVVFPPASHHQEVAIERVGDRVFFSSMTPILHDQDESGTLVAHIEIDGSFIATIERITNTHVLFLYEDTIIHNDGAEEGPNLRHLITDSGEPPDASGFLKERFYVDRSSLMAVKSSPAVFYSITDGSDILNLKRQSQVTMILVLLVTSVLAFCCSYLLYRYSFKRPLQLVMDGIREIGLGNLNSRIRLQSENEFADLAGAINSMADDLNVRDGKIGRLNRYLNLVLHSVRSGIVVVDEEGYIRDRNDAAEQMFSLAPGPDQPPRYTYLPEPISRRIGTSLARDAGTSTASERKIETATGKLVLGVQISPLMEQNKRIGVVVVLDDRTEVRELQQKLAVSERLAALGEMASSVAHQIRNPLGIIRVSAEMLAENAKRGERTPDDLELMSVILAEVDRLRTVADRFLHFGSPLSANVKPTPIEPLLTEILAVLRERHPLGSIDHQVVLSVPPDVPPLLIDEVLFSQAITNILTNSYEALGENPGTIEIVAYVEDGNVLVTIRDSGPGIPETMINRVYNPFFTTKETGTGLGLSVAQRCLEVQNVAMKIASEAYDGCTVTLTVSVGEE